MSSPRYAFYSSDILGSSATASTLNVLAKLQRNEKLTASVRVYKDDFKHMQ